MYFKYLYFINIFLIVLAGSPRVLAEDFFLRDYIESSETLYIGSCSLSLTEQHGALGLLIIGYIRAPTGYYDNGLTRKEIFLDYPGSHEIIDWMGQEVRDSVVMRTFEDSFTIRITDYTKEKRWWNSSVNRIILSLEYDNDGELESMHVRESRAQSILRLKSAYHLPFDYGFKCSGEPTLKDLFFPFD